MSDEERATDSQYELSAFFLKLSNIGQRFISG
jgi:hypothetical protein